MESHPYAFWVVSSGAAVLTMLIFAVGMRIMRRVRRVALSGRDSTPLRSLMTTQAWDAAIASLSHGPAPRILIPNRPRTPGGILAFLFRRRPFVNSGKKDEPLWINKNADLARARDASRAQEMGRDGHDKGSGGLRLLEKAWKEAGDCETTWANKWGSKTAKSKWVKE